MLLIIIKYIVRGFFPLILFIEDSYSQNNLVEASILSKNDSIPVSFANVSVYKSTIGTFSDDKGNFRLHCEEKDTLTISAIGYKTKQCKCETGIILLDADTISLEEVVVFAKKKQNSKAYSFEKGFFEEKVAGSYTGINAAGIFIENDRFIPLRLKKVMFRLSKVKFYNNEKNKKRYNLLVRLLLFSVNDLNKPDKFLINKNILQKVKEKKKEVIFDITEENIDIPVKGIFIGIEFLGYYVSNDFIPFDFEDTKKDVQYRPSFSKTNETSVSFIRSDINSQWKHFKIPDSNYNFNFSAIIEYP